jgi:hypothetical protein
VVNAWVGEGTVASPVASGRLKEIDTSVEMEIGFKDREEEARFPSAVLIGA